MKKTITFFVFLVSFNIMNAQCAMCKAVVEGGNETMAEGVNDGITYLMIFPYILVGLLFYALYKYRKKTKREES
ncbi:hypothetical protein ACOSP6_08325 [Tenacibaculum sp. MEBiC06402]|uniref:hypothetical protein n=1 Tax=unclassified Tenacibaculum TaxID=2635139 RepID=UPI003B9BB688